MNLDQIISGNEFVLVDFYADWCEPCKWAEPVLDELTGKFNGNLILHKLDIDRYPETARTYHILSVPTLVLFQKGTKVWSMRGFDTAPRLFSVLNTYINPAVA